MLTANTKADAIELLDEWGNAEQASVKRMTHCMFDFRLDDDGHIELTDVGGATQDLIMETCYPESTEPSPQRSGTNPGRATQRRGASKFEKPLNWSGPGNGAASRDRKRPKRP